MVTFEELVRFFKDGEKTPIFWIGCPIPFDRKDNRFWIIKRKSLVKNLQIKKNSTLKFFCGGTFVFKYNYLSELSDGILILKDPSPADFLYLDWACVFGPVEKEVEIKEIFKNKFQ